MDFVVKTFRKIFHKNQKIFNEKPEKFIFYKIVNFKEEEQIYTLQCINTNSIFFSKIEEIIFDIDILYSLHPIQSCYIGIEYSKFFKKNLSLKKISNFYQKKPNKYPMHRYGIYCLLYEDRKNNMCFSKITTDEVFLMDARDIAFSKELISEFDATQAFHIGFLAGSKINHSIKKTKNINSIYNPPNLKIVN